MMCGYFLKKQDQDTGSPDLYLQIVLVMVVDSSVKYVKQITKEKDPKGPYAINTCFNQSNKASKWNLYMYWNSTGP